MSIKPWLSIPTADAKVAVDYGFGDIRIMFKDSAAIEKTIADLEKLKLLMKEKEAHES